MNMGREYAGEDPKIGPWRDLQIEITGGATRTKFRNGFCRRLVFRYAGETARAGILSGAGMRAGAFLVQPMTDGPDGMDDPIQMSIVSMLNSARRRIWLTAGYFGPNEPLLTALQLAASRGVDVRMLVAGKSDHPYLVNIGRSYYEELLRYGVKIFEYKNPGSITRKWRWSMRNGS